MWPRKEEMTNSRSSKWKVELKNCIIFFFFINCFYFLRYYQDFFSSNWASEHEPCSHSLTSLSHLSTRMLYLCQDESWSALRFVLIIVNMVNVIPAKYQQVDIIIASVLACRLPVGPPALVKTEKDFHLDIHGPQRMSPPDLSCPPQP